MVSRLHHSVYTATYFPLSWSYFLKRAFGVRTTHYKTLLEYYNWSKLNIISGCLSGQSNNRIKYVVYGWLKSQESPQNLYWISAAPFQKHIYSLSPFLPLALSLSEQMLPHLIRSDPPRKNNIVRSPTLWHFALRPLSPNFSGFFSTHGEIKLFRDRQLNSFPGLEIAVWGLVFFAP